MLSGRQNSHAILVKKWVNPVEKIPLTRVPVISKVFSKLSIELVGPLIVTKKGNKYMLTVLCVFSKYPEAVPIQNMLSETVLETLMQIFSRLGYTKEVQTDLGRGFTSNVLRKIRSHVKTLKCVQSCLEQRGATTRDD